ncbi:alpha/beta-hydrolase [Flagelloscypha sp. PMI_526]|nr:alpha/beta-hydrolase [Flagelloscypha sp. PMI_526]
MTCLPSCRYLRSIITTQSPEALRIVYLSPRSWLITIIIIQLVLMHTIFATFPTVLLSVLTISRSLYAATVLTTITLDYGTFIGKSNSQYVSFQGIKYADAPRFRAPVMPPSENLGTVNATQFAKYCIQGRSSSPGTDQAEDCLFVNVYVPYGIDTPANVPVVAWFHGGGFVSGDTRGEMPDILFNSSSTPFIFTSFEYRLGPYGFLGGKIMEENGALNIGLRDQASILSSGGFSCGLIHGQRAGLAWLQKYICHFGGNPQDVTIWGQSAGAASTMFHLVSNRGNNEGLFVRALGDSPSHSYQPSKDDDFVSTLSNDFVTKAGCTGTDTFTCLINANLTTLMGASVSVINALSSAFSNGRFAKVPALFGSNIDDGSTWADSIVNDTGATLDNVYAFMQGQYPRLSRSTFDTAITNFYPLSDYGNSLKLLTDKLHGEARYICTTFMIIGPVAGSGISAYNFAFDNPGIDGLTHHGAELPAFYSSTSGDPSGLYSTMRKEWISFILTGSTASDGTWTMTGTDGWPRQWLHPGAYASQPVDDGLKARCDFWRSIDTELQR